MANDIDMWNDIITKEKLLGDCDSEVIDLMECFKAKYQESASDEELEQLKSDFEKNYGYWGNWY